MHEKFKRVSLAIRQPHNLGNLGGDRLSPVMSALSAADISLRDDEHILTHAPARTHRSIRGRTQKNEKHANSYKDTALSCTS